MKFPETIFTAWVQAPDGVAVNVSDDATSFDDVLYNAVGSVWGDVPFRIFRMDFDVETGALESTREVTEEAQQVVADRLKARGYLEAAE